MSFILKNNKFENNSSIFFKFASSYLLDQTYILSFSKLYYEEDFH